MQVIVTMLVWSWRSPVYPAEERLKARKPGSPPDPVPYALFAAVFGIVVVVFVGVRGM
jgi:hypothetical protein